MYVMNNPISVVMSVYNGEIYLYEAIESILNQTFTNFEFIIIDDGSTDNSAEIIKSYDDNRIVLIQQGNKGLAAALNEGIKIAKGKFIARMDADDISLPTRLETQIQFMEAHLEYVSQDFGQYDGKGDDKGLQTKKWDNTKLDIVSDITDIPVPDSSFDAIMCIEVFEHIPYPISALEEFSRILKRGGANFDSASMLTYSLCTLLFL